MDSDSRALVSVIMPVYNTPSELLERSVNSILLQSYINIELLIVDDGSERECAAKCDMFASSDARVNVLHQHNAGVSAARNAGLDAAEGEWIMFVDADDELCPDIIEQGVMLARDNCLDVLYAEVVDIEGSKATTRKLKMGDAGSLCVSADRSFIRDLQTYFISYESMDRSRVPRSLQIGPVAKLYRHRFICTKRFDTRLKNFEDALFNASVVADAERVGFLNTPWYLYKKNSKSAIHRMSFDNQAISHCAVVKEYVERNGICLDAYYSHVGTYFFFTLHALAMLNALSYEELKQGYGLPCFQEAFESLDCSRFDYPTRFERIKYGLATSGHLYSLWLVFMLRTLIKKIGV